MTMGSPPFEDVFPIEHGDFPVSHVSFQGCNIMGFFLSALKKNDLRKPPQKFSGQIVQLGTWIMGSPCE